MRRVVLRAAAVLTFVLSSGIPASSADDAVRLRLVDGRTLAGRIVEALPGGILFAPEDGSASVQIAWTEIDPDDPAARRRPGDPAEAAPRAVVRFIDGSQRTGRLERIDETGILFRAADDAAPVRFSWSEIDPEYAANLRAPAAPAAAGLPAAPGDPEFTVPGLSLTLQDGKTIRGLPRKELATAESIFLKTSAGPDPIRIDRSAIVRTEPLILRLTEVYTVHEAYQTIAERRFPATGADHRDLGDLLVRAGLADLALLHYRIASALERPESPDGRIYRELSRLRERVSDPALQEKVFDAQRAAFDADYDGAAARLEEARAGLAGAPEDVRNDADAAVRELLRLRDRSVEERMLADLAATADALILQKAADRTVGHDAGVAYVLERLPSELEERLALRYRTDAATVRKIRDLRPREGVEKHSYDEATWLAEHPEAADREARWQEAPARVRALLLKGRYVEKHLETVRIAHKACAACGGTGESRSVVPAGARVCPDCRGGKDVRVVFYR